MVDALQFVMEETATKRGPSTKSKFPVLKFYGLSEQEMEDAVVTEANSPPELYLFFKKDRKFDMAQVAGDNSVIDLRTNDVIRSVFVYVGCFIAFNIFYGRNVSNFLGFLQQAVVMIPYTGNKSSGFTELMKKVDEVKEEMMDGYRYKKYV